MQNHEVLKVINAEGEQLGKKDEQPVGEGRVREENGILSTSASSAPGYSPTCFSIFYLPP